MATKKKPTKKKAEKKPPTIKLETIQARHDFTEAEKSELGLKLAGLTQEKTRVEEEKKVAMSQWTTRIKGIQNDIAANSGKISSGFEMRDTECEVHFDWKAGKKTYVRKSDGKEIETRKIEEPERQQHLFEEEQAKNPAPKIVPLKPGEPIVSVAEAVAEAEQETDDEAS